MIIQLLRKHGFKYSYKNPETITRETDLTITCNFFLTKHAHSLQKAAIDFFYQDGQVIVKMRIGRPLSKRFMESDRWHGLSFIQGRQQEQSFQFHYIWMNSVKKEACKPNRIMHFVSRTSKDKVSKILTLIVTQECF